MRIIILAFILIILCSCSRKSTTETSNADSIIRIDLLSETEDKVTKLSEFAENVEYIPLETTESSLIGPIVLKVININNRIYLRNSGLNGEILCFDTDGKFLYKLQNRGRGPEEYTFISDFDVSFDNKFLTILSSSSSKLLIYGISDTAFVFKRSISLKDPVPYRVSIVPKTDMIFLAIPPWTGIEPTLSLLINTLGDTIHYRLNCYKHDMSRGRGQASNEMLVYSFWNMVCFKEEFSDTVFYIDANNNFFKPRMIFDTHGTLLTAEMRGNPERPVKNTTYIDYIFETSRYVFYWYDIWQEKPISNLVLFDKEAKIKHKLDIDSEYKCILKDDLSGGPDFNVEFVYNYCSGDKLFSFVESIILKDYVTGEDFRNAKVSDTIMKNKLKKITDSLDDTDNPVLIVVTPKE